MDNKMARWMWLTGINHDSICAASTCCPHFRPDVATKYVDTANHSAAVPVNDDQHRMWEV